MNHSNRVHTIEGKFKDSEFEKYFESFQLDCLMRNLTSVTIEGYAERLYALFSYLVDEDIAFASVTRQEIQRYVMSLKSAKSGASTEKNVSDETINGRIRVYRRFWNHLAEEGLWTGESPMAGIKLLKTSKRIKPVITPENIQTVISSINRKAFEGSRNIIIILLFWDGMLRKNEALTLKLNDIDLNGRLIRVFGKGRKERMVPLGVKTTRMLHRYIIRWRSKYPGDHLICMRNGRPLTERHCHKVIQRIGERVGIKLYPHLLRHSAATWYIQQGGNPAVLQKILGHTSLLVTQNYLHLSNADTVNSYNSFSPSNCLRI